MAFFYAVLKIIISMAIQALLSKQDDVEGPGASKLNPESINTASAEKSVPTFFGKVNFAASNILWYGDSSYKSVYREESAGYIADLINGEQKFFVGYKYYMGLQCSIGLSIDNTPIKLHSIFLDQDKFIFEDNAGITSSRKNINKPKVFGGTKDMPNGWSGNFEYYDGTQTTINSYLEGEIGAGEVPILKDLAHIVFEKNYIGNSRNPRTMVYEVSQYPVPSWGTDLEAKIGDDYNPVYALYYMLTNKTIGAGEDVNLIDIDSFKAAAAKVKAEEIGISLEVSNQIVFSDFQKTIEDIISGILSVDYNTGLYVIKLNRDDYDINTIPVLNESEISRLMWNKPTTNSLMTEMKVSFLNRENNYTKDLAIFSDLGVRYNKQAAKTTTLSFPWIKNASTASRIAGRELKSLSYPLITGNCIVSSKFIDLKRGDVVKIEYAPDNLDVPVRILSIDYGLLEENKVKIDFAEDFFGRFDASFAPPEPTKYTPSSQEALPADSYYVEAPFYLNKEQYGANFIILAEQPNESNAEYELFTDINGPYESNDVSNFSPTAELNTSIGLTDNSIIVKNGLLIEEVKNHTSSENRTGSNLFVIDDGTKQEWMAFESIVDNLDGTYTLNNVKRGIFHSKVKEFNVYSKILFITYGNTYISSLISGSVNYKVITKTLQDTLTINEAPTVNAVEQGVNMKNYPVIDLNINGSYFPASAPIAGFDITWSFQNRNEVNYFTDSKTYDGLSVCSIDIYEDGIFINNEQVSGKSFSYIPNGSATTARFVIKNITQGYNDSEEYDITVNLV